MLTTYTCLIGFISSLFSSQFTGATNAGLIRGAYHFAHPDESSGATQATFFLAHGGTLYYPIYSRVVTVLLILRYL